MNEENEIVELEEDLNLPSSQDDFEIKENSGAVGIEFSTGGRFTTPKLGYYKYYTTKQINDLGLTRQDDKLETLLSILNQVNVNNEIQAEDLLLEELFEVVVAIKRKFRGNWHTHKWYCEECQKDVEDKDKVVSEMDIDLSTLKEISIEESDDNFRSFMKQRYEKLKTQNPTIFLQQMKILKPDLSIDIPNDVNIDEVLKNINIKEPFNITCPVTKKKYSFRFTRVGDYIKAKRFIDLKYSPQLKNVKKERWNSKGSLAEFKHSQEFKLNQLNEQKAKDTLLAAKAFSLVTVNGKELKDTERFNELSNMNPITAEALAEVLENQKFGIQDERDYTCNLCGHTERGYLMRRTSVLEFILDNSSSNGRSRLSNEEIVLFGF
jgi:rubrerythrin